VSPYCDLYGGYVLNATIDRYAYAMIRMREAPGVRFVSSDRQVQQAVAPAEPPGEGPLRLHEAVYRTMVERYNDGRPIALELTTYCDAPVGSGLGASSTLVVAMVRAFAELLNIPLDDYAIARLAYQIERVDCGLQGGRQDQYSAAFGGFNFMEFYADERAVINPLRIKNWIVCELEASLVLYYAGVSRESARIIADQSENVRSGAAQAVEAMHGLKRQALATKECLLRGDFDGLIESMREGWESKKRSASSVTNERLDQIYEAAVGAGARAGKVSGAGGGGFMMFFVAPERRMEVIRALDSFGGQVSNCHFTEHGTQAWTR
jgi:D-glycero-alpha-D-manno-heptose-7-phosphate kinase